MSPVGLILAAIPPVLQGMSAIGSAWRKENVLDVIEGWAEIVYDVQTELKTLKAGEDLPAKLKDQIVKILHTLTLKQGYSPAYTYDRLIAVPIDQLTDLIDLLAAGSVRRGLMEMVTGGKAEQAREAWNAILESGDDDAILKAHRAWLVKRGRVRSYSVTPAIKVDLDWLADSCTFLIG